MKIQSGALIFRDGAVKKRKKKNLECKKYFERFPKKGGPKKWKKSPGLRPMACQIVDIIILFHWISFLVVLVLGFRFTVFLGTDQAQHTRSAPIPKETNPGGDGHTPVGGCRTPRDMSLKIAPVFHQFVCSFFDGFFCSKMFPQIAPKP